MARAGSRVRLSASERRRQIVDVATRLIAERGYWGTSINDIATECAITDAGVLHHFPTKGNLLLSVMEKRDEADRVALANSLGLTRDTLYDRIHSVGLTELSTAMVQRNATQPEIVQLYSVLSTESLEPDHPAHEYFRDRENLAIETFGSAASTLSLTPVQRGRLVLSLMDGLQLRWLRAPSDMDLVAEWSAVCKQLL